MAASRRFGAAFRETLIMNVEYLEAEFIEIIEINDADSVADPGCGYDVPDEVHFA